MSVTKKESGTKVKPYTGRRDPRFVTLRRGGSLEDSQHRLLAAWAADCAEHVLEYFESEHPGDKRPRSAIDQARAWSRGEISMTKAREAAYAAHAAARTACGAAREVARACGHAAATAHMADHELGAAVYALRAVRAVATAESKDQMGKLECLWQRDQLPAAVRKLVLSDQENRNKKLWSLFNC